MQSFCIGVSGQTLEEVKTKIQGRQKITTYHVRDTISLSNRTVFIDTTVKVISPNLKYIAPNYMGRTLMTPTAWGADRSGILFGGIGGTFPQIYSSEPDLIAVLGTTIGDANKILGAKVMLNINDVSSFDNFSANLILDKHLSDADAISVGGIHLFASAESDAGPSYYIAYSHAVRWLLSSSTGAPALQYTLGVGTGRFYEKSPYESVLGRGTHGTAVFANVSYELFRCTYVNLEWSGTNLHASASFLLPGYWPTVSLGLADLTRYSGEGVRFIVWVGYSYYLPGNRWRSNEKKN